MWVRTHDGQAPELGQAVMSEIASWAQTPAGLLANSGWQPGDRAVELAKRQFQQAPGRAEFEARLAANPEGVSKTQAAGGPGCPWLDRDAD